jgi:hypothetical protein
MAALSGAPNANHLYCVCVPYGTILYVHTQSSGSSCTIHLPMKISVRRFLPVLLCNLNSNCLFYFDYIDRKNRKDDPRNTSTNLERRHWDDLDIIITFWSELTTEQLLQVSVCQWFRCPREYETRNKTVHHPQMQQASSKWITGSSLASKIALLTHDYLPYHHHRSECMMHVHGRVGFFMRGNTVDDVVIRRNKMDCSRVVYPQETVQETRWATSRCCRMQSSSTCLWCRPNLAGNALLTWLICTRLSYTEEYSSQCLLKCDVIT